ncbi:Maf family protein [Devosia rhizoryzae]|uniref:Nucleoside triphosphate pyrophosphatase n=1 Tax=Devosia rhizoryzae TaxID=2774137 RepID=A0ABX7CAH4_9HYPH|nr:Maf family protein [Devosia rhizoryzae]QQR41269.1 Maf family protein [Devosia rhizoryzae]
MLILASRSPTRKSLLQQAKLPFSVDAASVDERTLEAEALRGGADAAEVAQLLAQAKARAVSVNHSGALAIGADQILALGETLLHKPETMADAAGQLDRLRGKTHRLHAAVTLVRDGKVLWSDVQTAELTMRTFSDEERDQVLRLEGEEVLHSVGSYRLEGPSIRLFEAVCGDYFTILGLPLLPLLAALRDIAPELFSA